MGLRYYDAGQFLDAVKRNDALAVALYVEGHGVNLAARDVNGRSALDIARAAGESADRRNVERGAAVGFVRRCSELQPEHPRARV